MAQSHSAQLSEILPDLTAAVESADFQLSDREMALIVDLVLSVIAANEGTSLDSSAMVSAALGRIVSDCSIDDVQRTALQGLLALSGRPHFVLSNQVLFELFSLQLRTFDAPSLALANKVLANASEVEQNAESLLEDGLYPTLFDWFHSVLSQEELAMGDCAQLVRNVTSYQTLLSRCFHIGFETQVQTLLDSNMMPKSAQKLLLESLSTLELEKKRLRREESNARSRSRMSERALSSSPIQPLLNA